MQVLSFFILLAAVLGSWIHLAGTEAGATVVITHPSGPMAFGETPDYATLVWNDPWDMDQPLDIRQLDSPRCVFPNHFNDNLSWCPTGIWCGQAIVDNPDFFLLHPGYAGALYVGREGNARPIDTSQYTQLTFRMYISQVDPNDPGFQIVWTNGTVADIGDLNNPARFGGTVLYKSYPGWNIYTIDLRKYQNYAAPAPHRGTLPWTGLITGLRLDPGFIGMTGKIVQLDWVRLSSPSTRRIDWTTSQSGPVTIRLQTQDELGADDPLRMYQYQYPDTYSIPLQIQASQRNYDLPASLPPGNWYVQLVINGEASQPAGPWQIEKAPTLRFIRPSYTSGESFSEAKLNKTWEMDSPTDIYSFHNTSVPQFSDGLLTATTLDTNPSNTCSGYWEDPHLTLLNEFSDPPIETNKYRYLTFRLKVEGTPDVSYGWVSRVVWSNYLFTHCGVTNDIPLHGGWNEVSLDLWASNILDNEDPCQSPWRANPLRSQLRFDPIETPEQTVFHIDYIKLTAPETISRNSVFPIEYHLNKTGNVSVTFYYDSDKNPANGRTLIGSLNPPARLLSLPYKVYLPFITGNNSTLSSNQIFNWDLQNVPPGSYFISAEISDGFNTTTWYSDTPVVVTP